MDTISFSKLLTIWWSALTVLFGPGSCDTTARSWRKRWKHWGGSGSSTLKTASREVNSSFVRCGDEGGYQQRLAALFAEVHLRTVVPTVLATDLLCLAKDIGYLYFVANTFYWAKDFHFETRVSDRQGLFAGWQNVELFRMPISDRDKYSCQVLAPWLQQEASILLFVPMPLILAYYSGFAIRGSTDDQTRVWTIALTEYVFMAGYMFLINARDGAYLSYYTYNSWFDNLSINLVVLSPRQDFGRIEVFSFI